MFHSSTPLLLYLFYVFRFCQSDNKHEVLSTIFTHIQYILIECTMIDIKFRWFCLLLIHIFICWPDFIFTCSNLTGVNSVPGALVVLRCLALGLSRTNCQESTCLSTKVKTFLFYNWQPISVIHASYIQFISLF